MIERSGRAEPSAQVYWKTMAARASQIRVEVPCGTCSGATISCSFSWLDGVPNESTVAWPVFGEAEFIASTILTTVAEQKAMGPSDGKAQWCSGAAKKSSDRSNQGLCFRHGEDIKDSLRKDRGPGTGIDPQTFTPEALGIVPCGVCSSVGLGLALFVLRKETALSACPAPTARP